MNSGMGNLLLSLVFVFDVVLTLGAATVAAFFLLSLQRALELCSPQNRTLAPGKVWLCFIPLFNVVWIFVVVSRVASSLRHEFESRSSPSEDYGRTIGLTYCILAATALVTAIIPFVGALTRIACLVCLIIYWVKISGYSKRLKQGKAIPEAGWDQETAEVEGQFDLSKAWLVLLILVFASGAQRLQGIGLTWFSTLLQHQFRLNSSDLGVVFSSYTFGFIGGCVLLAIVTSLCGTRWGLVTALAGMSLAATGWLLVSGQVGLLAVRVLSGFFAGGLIPAAIQSLREYFPASKRPLAIGIFIAASPVASLLASPLGHHIAATVDWRMALTAMALPSVVAAALCWFVWRQPARPAGPRSASSLGVVSAVMLGVGILFSAPLLTFVQTWAPIMLVRRSMGASLGTLSTVSFASAAGGALVAGVAAWAIMRAGAGSWKTRATLLIFFGLALTIAALGGVYAMNNMLVVSALVAGAFQAWSTLLYSAVADTLPVRGVSVGAAAGSLIMAAVGVFSTPLLASLTSVSGAGAVFGILAGLVAVGLVCVGLLAWLIHPEPPLLPAVAPAAA